MASKKSKHSLATPLHFKEKTVKDFSKDAGRKNILILIHTSWGEIDWILPICYHIKNNYPLVRLSVVFNALDSNQIVKGNELLLNLLENGVHDCYELKDFLPGFLRRLFDFIQMQIYEKNRWNKLKPYIENYFFGFLKILSSGRMIKKIDPQVLLKDFAPDRYVRKRIVSLARKRGCREVMFHHATEFHYMDYVELTRDHCFADDILCNTKWMTEMFSDGNEIYRNRKHIVGIPRYDDWWIQYLQNYWKRHIFKKYVLDPKSTIFLFFTQEAHPTYIFSEETAEQIIHEVVEVALSFQNSFLIIKPHPRQNIDLLNKRLESYDKNRWVMDQSQAMYLSKIADVIICMGLSSVVLDSLAVDKCAIEYYKHTDIKYVDEYGKLGLVASASNIDELKNWIGKIRSNPDKEGKIFIEKFREIIPKSYDGATKKAVAVILDLKNM